MIEEQLLNPPSWRTKQEICAISCEDEGNYEEPESLRDFIVLGICLVASYIFSLIYLAILFLFALAGCVKLPGSTSEYKGFSAENDPDSLKFDLQYYVRLEGYDLEEFTAETQDGFHLLMHRIVVPGEPKELSKKRYPVLLLHGLLQSSAAYCTSGENSLAFHLVKAGYDVWLGNNRCGFNPKHTFHCKANLKMWAWRLREMGTFDLPSLVDRILECRPEFEKIALVAHSQGTAQTFLALAKDCAPELGKKLSCFCALSPAVYTGPLVNRWFLGFIKYLSLPAYRLFFGYHDYMSIMMTMHSLLTPKLYSSLGFIMFRYLFSWDDKLWNSKYRDRQLLFSPVHISAELMFWWLGKDGFAARGCLFRHESEAHPWFDEQFPPLMLVVPGLDDLVNPYKLMSRLEKVETDLRKVHITEIPEYSHLDVLWAKDVAEKVGVPLVEFLEENR